MNKAAIKRQKAVEKALRLQPKPHSYLAEKNPSYHDVMQTKIKDSKSADVLDKKGRNRTLPNGSVIVGVYPNIGGR